MTAANSHQWLVFELCEQAYGFNLDQVREIVSLRNLRIHRMPQTPVAVEGVVLLRDQPIEVIDVRSTLGLCSLRKETDGITNMLQEREADHCRWIEELEACVQEHRQFRLATDPHKCKFGQWYDKLSSHPRGFSQLTNSDLALNSLFAQLNQPHQRIHAIAQQVLSHATAGRSSEARQIIDETRDTELRALRQLFSKCREQIEIVRRGLLLVLTAEDGLFGGLVDRVAEVVNFSQDAIRPIEWTNREQDLLVGVVQWGEAGRMVQLLNVAALGRLRCNQPAPKVACPA